MTQSLPHALPAARRALRLVIVLNWLIGLAILALLIVTIADADLAVQGLGLADARMLMGGRAMMLIGIAATPIANLVLTRLLAIVQTVDAGDPFVMENAQRLQTIAWAVLTLELLHLVVVGIASAISSPAHPLHIRSSLSVTPWLAILLLFVLAGVFEHGAHMREDLQGTV